MNEPHYFKWHGSDEPYTTDPRYRDKLKSGRHNRVTVDGVEIMYAREFVTGTDGWVERQVRDHEDRFVLDKDNNLLVEVVTGHVEYTDLRDPKLSAHGLRLYREPSDDMGLIWPVLGSIGLILTMIMTILLIYHLG